MSIKLLTAAIVSAAALLTPGVALADWINISNSSDTQYFIDDSNFERRGDTAFYWQKTVSAVPQLGSVKSLITSNSTNCASRVSRTHRGIAYNNAGRVIDDFKYSEQELPPEEIIPGTIGEIIYEAVCSN